MRVERRQCHEAPATRGRGVPPAEGIHRPVEQRGDRSARAEGIGQQRDGHIEARLIAPGAVGVEPLEPIDRRGAIAPREGSARRVWMRREPEPALPPHIVDDLGRGTTEPVRRGAVEPQRHVVSTGGADLHRIDDEHRRAVTRGLGRSRRITVVGDDDEVEASVCGRTSDVIDRSRAVGAVRVDVVGAAPLGVPPQRLGLVETHRERGRRQTHPQRDGHARRRGNEDAPEASHRTSPRQVVRA